MLGGRRVSLRLLDPSHTQLLATARSGEPLHRETMEFRVGEGLLGWIAAHGEPLCLAEPEADPRFAPRPGMGPMGAFIGVPIRSGAQVIGVLSAIDPAVRFDDHHRQLLELVAAMCAPHIELARLADLIQLDPLTGSLNRRGLDQRYPVDHVADADAAPLVVAMLDLDHFKRSAIWSCATSPRSSVRRCAPTTRWCGSAARSSCCSCPASIASAAPASPSACAPRWPARRRRSPAARW